jgi:murein DD-endopeptidase MepM/ murein hydrolase activator NlpD
MGAPITPTLTPTPTPTPTSPAAPTPVPRFRNRAGSVAFAQRGPVTLLLPADVIEHIGFHESGHDGARQLRVLDSGTPVTVLDSRDRGTGSRTAADIVVRPGIEIRSPVSGTVLSSGTYTLYCEYSDDFVFIEPVDRPGWQVKIFHIDGVLVTPGQQVEAGVTVLAGRATVLPFDSQVDEVTARPPWPHVHVEIVDPSIPDRPSPGGGC